MITSIHTGKSYNTNDFNIIAVGNSFVEKQFAHWYQGGNLPRPAQLPIYGTQPRSFICDEAESIVVNFEITFRSTPRFISSIGYHANDQLVIDRICRENAHSNLFTIEQPVCNYDSHFSYTVSLPFASNANQYESYLDSFGECIFAGQTVQEVCINIITKDQTIDSLINLDQLSIALAIVRKQHGLTLTFINGLFESNDGLAVRCRDNKGRGKLLFDQYSVTEITSLFDLVFSKQEISQFRSQLSKSEFINAQRNSFKIRNDINNAY